MAKPTKQRLLEAGIKLFAEQGFRETSIGEIEQAAGLTPRAGGFYRHFPAKDDLLKTALEDYFDDINADLAIGDVLPLGDTRAELILMARTILKHARRNRDVRRIVRREWRHIKGVAERAHEIAQVDAYKDVLEWTTKKLKDCGKDHLEPTATTVAIFGSVFFLLFTLDQGDLPLGIDEEPFLDAWSEMALGLLS